MMVGAKECLWPLRLPVSRGIAAMRLLVIEGAEGLRGRPASVRGVFWRYSLWKGALYSRDTCRRGRSFCDHSGFRPAGGAPPVPPRSRSEFAWIPERAAVCVEECSWRGTECLAANADGARRTGLGWRLVVVVLLVMMMVMGAVGGESSMGEWLIPRGRGNRVAPIGLNASERSERSERS